MTPVSRPPQMPSPDPERSDRAWTTAALLLLYGAALVTALCPHEVRNPPRGDPGWSLVATLALPGLLAAFRTSIRRSCTKERRVWLGLAIGAAVLALGISLEVYRANYHRYPAESAALPWLLVLGGLTCRQYWLVVVVPAFLALWFQGALVSPGAALPRTASEGGLTASLREEDGIGAGCWYVLELRGPEGARLTDLYDLRRVSVIGIAPPFIGFRGSALWQRYTERLRPRNAAVLSVQVRPPEWTRTFDLELEVPGRPRKAAASVPVPVPSGGQTIPELFAVGDGVTLSVSNVRWSTSQHRLPPVRCLALRLRLTGYSDSASMGPELRAVDDRERIHALRNWSILGDEDGTIIESEIDDLPASAKEVRIDAFSARQMTEATRVFRFSRLPYRAGER
jgi:hypothetical protein